MTRGGSPARARERPRVCPKKGNLSAVRSDRRRGVGELQRYEPLLRQLLDEVSQRAQAYELPTASTPIPPRRAAAARTGSPADSAGWANLCTHPLEYRLRKARSASALHAHLPCHRRHGHKRWAGKKGRRTPGHRVDVTDIGSPQRPCREGFDVGKTNVDCVAHAAAPPWTAATRVSGANALNISSTYQRTKTRVPSSISSEYGPGR
jgi:hypothetical protein